MRPNPLHDVGVFLTKASGLTAAFWVLMFGSVIIACIALAREPQQRSFRDLAVWVARFFLGAMWWQQSLWKVPPDYGGLVYWMKQMVAHSAIEAQSNLVRVIAIPHIAIFGPLQYAIEVAIGVSLILGLLTRVSSVIGLLMAINLWLGLYSAPGEWPWTYFFLILLQWLFTAEPPGRSLGLDALWLGRARREARPSFAAWVA